MADRTSLTAALFRQSSPQPVGPPDPKVAETPPRQSGDLARARGLWQRAAQSYREHLRDAPDDFAIWVQLGNCLKEAGAFSEALDAYDRAMALDGSDADVLLQKGHLLKLMGKTDLALRCYQGAVRLKPRSSDAIVELLSLGSRAEVAELLADADSAWRQVPAVYLDVSDLIEYAHHNLTWSGIQRVTSNVMLQAGAVERGNEPMRLVPVVPDYATKQAFEVGIGLVTSLIETIDSGMGERAGVERLIAAILDTKRPFEPAPGDVFLLAGAFWTYENFDLVPPLREAGVRFGIFVHDLIQIKNPEYVHQTATVVFRERLVDALPLADFIVTSSRFVADEVKEFASARLDLTVPLRTVPLATEFRAPARARARISPAILDLCRDEFVLCVCTIEVRKNHRYLIRIWERLRRQHGGRTPNLVFVGKWGWDIDELRRDLEESGYIGDWLFILNELPDVDLDHLYRHCLFTAYVSFAEGWGLPVGESLAHGKPCIASNVTSIPEVGGSLVRYVDPTDLADGYRVIEGLLADRSDLARWTEAIRKGFKPKSWADYSIELLDAVRELRGEPSAKSANLPCRLPYGKLLFGGGDDIARLDQEEQPLVTFRGARRDGWHPPEGWGVWTAGRRARLGFQTDLADGEPVQLCLLLKRPPESERARCLIRIGRCETLAGTLQEFATVVHVDGTVSPGGRVDIEIVSQGIYSDGRFAGLMALAYCRPTDLGARVAILEALARWQSRRSSS